MTERSPDFNVATHQYTARCTGCGAQVPIIVPDYIPSAQKDMYTKIKGKQISDNYKKRTLSNQPQGT